LELNSSEGNGICSGTTVDFSLSASAGQIYSFLLNGIEVHENPFWSDVDSLSDGDRITGIVETADGCKDSISLQMSVQRKPILSALPASPLIIGESGSELVLFSDLDATEYVWRIFNDNGFSENKVTIPVDSGEVYRIPLSFPNSNLFSPQNYTFQIVPVSIGCIGDSATLQLTFLPRPDSIFIPEVITPNGDGFNDSWQITWADHIRPEDYRIEVYDRHGMQVFRTSPLHGNWQGEGLPDGVYHWVLWTSEGTIQNKGGLTIRRQ
ncbi:MAG: gliding motility-associated C-terminal domain-containing protein, partial [Bacteroidota bacterium]